MITGYNLPHLRDFTTDQLNDLADILPKDLTYRLYGGEESRAYTLDAKMIAFLERAQTSKVIVVETVEGATDLDYNILRDHGINAIKQWENEPYLFSPPTWRDGFWNWFDYNYRKPRYYRRLAQRHLVQFTIKATSSDHLIYYNLPLKVHDNAGFKEYAKVFLQSGLAFRIDLHAYGVNENFIRNLEWYRDNITNQTVSFNEFYGLNNTREASEAKNKMGHEATTNFMDFHTSQILGDKLYEKLHFCLAANEVAMNWQNPPFLHRFEFDGNIILDTLNNLTIW